MLSAVHLFDAAVHITLTTLMLSSTTLFELRRSVLDLRQSSYSCRHPTDQVLRQRSEIFFRFPDNGAFDSLHWKLLICPEIGKASGD